MSHQPSSTDLWLMNDAFPQGRLLESYYDRDVTRLSDRGLASNMIGDRWSDICAEVVESWPGSAITLPDGITVQVESVYRLDAIPQLARIASKRGLQNPDFILSGTENGETILAAIDAKFSIDTAKNSQVAADTLTALLEVGELITDLLPGIDLQVRVLDGYFLSPESPLTDYVLNLRRGRLAARVRRDRVILLPLTPVQFIKPLQGSRLIGTVATIDGLRQEIRSNLLLAMYYFRLVRACFGAYIESKTPLLGAMGTPMVNEPDIEQITIEMARGIQSSWQLVLSWDERAEHVRRQRDAVNVATNLPMRSHELRDRVVAEAELRGIDAPSINSVRRAFGSWYRQQFDDAIGTIPAPVDDLPGLLERIHTVAATLTPEVQPALERVLDAAFAQKASELNAE
ncbi:MAG: hypothetical protein KC435_01375 [Thermomicrobiales bacterium]|nr:hypothetical protein [Thermomicrobiales bacterium]